MNFFKINVFFPLFACLPIISSIAHAADSEVEQVYRSTNVKAALVNACNQQTVRSGKLSTTEVSKFCSCQIEAKGRVTDAARWDIQSMLNQKKDPGTLIFVQQQNHALQACLGPELISKLKTLSDAGNVEKVKQ